MNIKRASRPIMIAAATAAVASGMGVYAWHERERPKELEIYVFDVKGGPSFLIRTPDDQRIVIDGGANSDVIRRITDVMPFYSRHIDAIIATAHDASRVSGLIDVVDRYDIGSAYIPVLDPVSAGIGSTTDPAFTVLMNKLSEKKIPVHEITATDTISFGGGVFGGVLFPLPFDEFAYSKASAPELVMRIYFGDTSLMILGNASKKIQKVIASSTDPSDVLVVSGNDSPDSFAATFLERVNPRFLVYSKAIAKTKSKPAKKTADPLAGVPVPNRLNVRERRVVRFISDGRTIQPK